MELPVLSEHALVGGTALSLKYGHRKSIDLDIFCSKPFSISQNNEELKNTFGKSYENRNPNLPFGIFCFIDDIKVDLVKHPHPLIGKIEEKEGIRFFSDRDIMAMKIQAVLGRADFYDIAELLQHYPVSDFIHAYKEKYSTQNLLISIPQAMTFFQDAEDDMEPVSKTNKDWGKVKKLIQEKVRDYLISNS